MQPQNKSFPLNGRKRCRNESSWKCNVAKKRRNFGKEYISVFTKKSVPSRTLKPDCAEKNCKLKCCEKIIDRQNIFNIFWNIGDHTKQLIYIMKPVIRQNKKDVQVMVLVLEELFRLFTT